MQLSKESSVLIATFSPWIKGKRLPINGNLEPMLDFFIPKVKKTVLIDQVYPGSDFVMPRTEFYISKKKNLKSPSWWMYTLYPFLLLANKGGTHIVFKLRDFLSVFDAAYSDRSVYDYFIGFEAVNAIAGYFLKKMGRVKIVIYYVSDYSPKRYKQNWFNNLYLSLDRYAAMHADMIWDVSRAMQPARVKAGLDPKNSAPVLIVPNALYPYQIKQLPVKKVIPHSLVFMGTLGPENGPDIAVESLPYILKKFRDSTLHIVGGNESDLQRLQALTAALHLQKYVIFHGFIADRKMVSREIQQYAIALAPYKYIPGSPRLYGDATKIRAYMAAGLPTITTQVPPLGREVENAGAAFVVKDDPKDIAEVVNKIFKDEKLFLQLRKNAIAFAKENTWDNEYRKAFLAMERIL
jgi:glycosyltransferase involved in cell wall biosynthesis